MVEIALSVAAKVAEYLVAPIARPFGYIWNYKTNFDNLKTEVQKLEGQRVTVQHSVDEARRNGEQIEKHVSDWLDRVKTMTDEASEVTEENQRADMKCFKGLCPNPKKHYQHSRKAVKKANAIVGLYADGNFQTVSFRTIPEETWIPSYKDYMVFESRMSTLKNILDALSNPDVNMVGIYGTGGIGKTTLAREIAGHAVDKRLFNVVAFAEVAVKPDIKEIQHEIADKLCLRFQDESPSGRARSLQERLKQEEKVLLVLDNIWERLNLEDVGIPFGNDHKGCKLLLTARNLDVLSKMDSQRNFEVDFLDKGEAWSLFEKKAGSCDHLQGLAKNVAKACGGLPIAIDSVAVALKNKEEFEWKDALRKLTTPSSSNFEGVAAETYLSIEISYSQLKERELKSTFLLCCIMGYTYVEDLLGYGMGFGIFQDLQAMEEGRNRVNTLVRKLKDSSPVLDIKNNKISLHDVVRDVGRSIASRDGHMFTVTNNCIPREWVDKDTLKNCVGISLYNISKLPEEFECPELQFFYLRTISTNYCRVPDNFFAGMLKLKVLHLTGWELYSVPNSIRLLVNLRTLNLYDCKIRDVDFIGEFKQLEILRIRSSHSSEIEMIPKKMCNLTGLRLLDLNGCKYLRNIPPNVLSTFTQLEELYLPSSIEWEVEGVNILDELKHLKHLTALKISIPDDSVLPKGRLVSNKLERYNIIIGNCNRYGNKFWNWYDIIIETCKCHGFVGQTSRIVKLNLETNSCSDDVQKFFSLLDREGFPELEHLHVENSPCFRTVVDCLESESCHHFLFLQSLSLDSVLNLEMIHNYPLKDKADSFRQLRTITVKFCHKLKNILSFSTYRALPLLQEVNVSFCDNMEEIFASNRREEDINNNEGTDQIEFKHLRSLTLKYLPKLTSFCSINNNKDMFDTPTLLFNQKVSFSSLEVIEISKMDDLETIWSNQLCNDSFCNLKSLKVTKCNKLLTIFQSNMLKRILRLESLTICDCDLVEEIFDLQGVDFEELTPPEETLLRELDINGLPKLKHIWNKDPQKMFSFQKLNNVKVHHCMSLKYLFPFSIAESLSELEQLAVYYCGVEEIVADDQGKAKVAATFVFPRITSLELNNLPRLKTFYSGVHASQWQNLKRLVMRGCDKAELFASELFNFQENIEGQHDSSLQPFFMVEKVSFSSLEVIEISKMEDLEKIWSNQLCNDSFCNLKSLKVTKCNKLLTIFQSNMLERILRLESLTIYDCDLVEEIFDLQGVDFEELPPPKETLLRELDINGLPKLKHIWNKDPQKMFSFQKLNNVKVHHCMSLKYLFPFSIAESLSELEQLAVYYCGVEEIVADDQGKAKVAATFVFPRITSLELNNLPRLKTFYSGVHASQWQNLKRLVMRGCDKAELFASELFNFQENIEGQHDSSLQPFFMVEKVSFSSLEVIEISKMEDLEKIWSNQLCNDSFCNLKSLKVTKCNKLLTIFQSNMLERILRLESLTIYDCDLVEEIFDLQGVDFEELPPPKETLLRELDINGLPKLKHIWNKDPQKMFSFQKLNNVKVHHCMSLKYLFPFSIAESLSELEQLAVYYCGLEEIVADDQGKAKVAATFVFPRITYLELNNLPRLKTFYRGIHASQWQNLKRLVMRGCDKVELFASELFHFQENNEGQSDTPVQPLFIVEKVTFPSLEEVKISESNNLKILWQKGAKESFCNLKSVEVSGCNELLTIFQFNTLEGLSMSKLLTVAISNCASVEEIFDFQKVNFEESHSRAVMYHQLQQLNINRLPKLKHIWKKDPQAELSFEELPMPKSLKVRYCDSIEEIFDLQKVNFEESHSRAVMYRLQELNLEGLPKLKHIWNKDPRVELSFESLQQVKVSGCQSLKDLFPASIARNLSQLVQLNVDRCGKLEEIVAKEGEAKEATRFVFPKVTSITLDRLPQLKTFYRGVHSSKWEVLKELEVVGCDKIGLLASQLSCFQENNIDISVQPPFFLVEKDSFPILEKLILIGGGARMMLQFSEELFCKLKFLQVYNDKSVVLFPLCILQRFRHLHELHLKSSSYKEIFLYEEDETHVGVDSKLDMVLSKLEKLTVRDCQNLIQLVPSSTSFENLTVLKVWSCNGLKNLMTSSTAKRLVQLREMAIGSCQSMIDVVAKGGDVTEDKIIFSKLRTLRLADLPSLSCFCSENYTFELPSLEEIIVYKCPEMKYFSLGDTTTRILQEVRRGSTDYTLEGGLNTTIQKTRNSRVDDSRDLVMEHYIQSH